jgi:hypothetical protein
MRVAAVLFPAATVADANAPCHKKNPMTSTGSVHSKTILQEDFIKPIQYIAIDFAQRRLVRTHPAWWQLPQSSDSDQR